MMNRKKNLKNLLTFLLFIYSALNSTLTAQNISVYATPIEQQVKGELLNFQHYQLSEGAVVNYDNGKWVAVRIEIPDNLATKHHFIHLSYSLLDTVELWTPNSKNTLELTYQTGQAFDFSSRPYNSADFVFPLTESVKEYYFRIYSSKPVVLPFEVLSEKKLVKVLTDKDFLFGAYAGIIFVMFLYNLALFFIVKDKSYVYYILYLLALVITQLALFGYTDRFLLSESPELNQKFAVLSGATVAIVSVFFVVHFLQLRQKAPLFAKLMFLVIVLDAFGILFLIQDWDVLAFHWVNITSLYGSIIAIIAGWQLAAKGFKPAKFFVIAWSLFLISVIVFALINIGIIPYNPYLHGAMLYGSGAEVVLLSVALADRINELRKEKEDSKEKALELAQKNEQIILQQNTFLEEKVALRTQELKESNNELKKALENLKATQGQLIQSEKMASLGILTAGVAHEINNPLNYIDGGYQSIMNKLKKKNKDLKEEDIQENLRWIKVGVDRATKIVKNLNAFSRSEESTVDDCNLNEIIENCIRLIHHKTNDDIEIQTTLQKEGVVVKCNSNKLQQVILNLLDNAIDAVDGMKGIIKISTKTNETNIILSIEDNGCGISEKNLTKILDPFYTTKDPDKGTGLGLSIAHSIIQEHGGTINFDSKLGKRTEVIIQFPIL